MLQFACFHHMFSLNAFTRCAYWTFSLHSFTMCLPHYFPFAFPLCVFTIYFHCMFSVSGFTTCFHMFSLCVLNVRDAFDVFRESPPDFAHRLPAEAAAEPRRCSPTQPRRDTNRNDFVQSFHRAFSPKHKTHKMLAGEKWISGM